MIRLAARIAVLLLAVSAAAAADTAAAPGSLVRWTGEGTERCAMAGKSWRPLGETCFYPIDLLADEKTLAVERWRAGRRETAQVRVADYPYPVQHITLEDDTRVHLSKEDGARAARESQRVGAVLGRISSPRRFTLPLAPPLSPLPEGGRFGSRRFFNGEPRSPHSGADYSAPAGAPVHAVAAGEVVLAEEHFFAGKSVFLDHGDGLITMYFHLSGIAVEEGDEVEAGEIVGLVGASGRATGPHLHFGARWRGARVDPSQLFDPGRAPAIEP